MRVLVIRPREQGAATAEKIAELGHEAVVLPLFEPFHDLDAAVQALTEPHDVIAITSAEALRCLAKLGQAIEHHLDTPLFAVGKTTARHARELGFTKVTATQGGGAALAAEIAGRFVTQDASVLYLSAIKRSPDFEATLQEHGFACRTAEVYGMSPIDYSLTDQQKLLVNNPVDAAFLFSKDNARAFFDLEVFRQSKESLRKTLFFCLSRNIAAAVPEEFVNSVVVSLSPDEDELIDLL
ncbi:uroporphyrinogen-III synthase [Rhizobium sp. SG_E_25_P2]|uniref:uroporphyrinogen-III synthase n=1 Tax=Rhizobium sp. SG_E_25_P2 TaxID=2879942 RepID=UPI0024734BFF|nr:uroporphyrinogen-III synthase [Rhizobium sp. SG_E_25_P2]MDH6267587.1 uroporphyrinogen-III synthase [Rhizobium sp. SG_E_25_P2]